MGHRIYRGVAQGTQVGIDAIIDAVVMWEGQIGDEPPFPSVMPLRDYPDPVDVHRWELRGVPERAQHATE